MRKLNWILAAGLLVLLVWRGQKIPVVTASAGTPFVESMKEAKILRTWVTDALPPGTTLLGYQHEDGWDGTFYDEWALHNPSGFDAFKRPNAQRTVLEVLSDPEYADTAYKVLEIHLRHYGFRVDGQKSPDLWTADWKMDVKNTQIRGTVYPHAHGEVLLIERITVK